MTNALSSVADQATSSGTNFALNVLLARWLSKSDYGAFSVSWSFCLIFAALHNALILEPMTVVGPAEYGSTLKAYLRAVARLNWFVVLALGLLAGAAALCYRESGVRIALATLALCIPGYLLLLTARREQYVLNRPIRAFGISLVYAWTLAFLFLLLHANGWLSALTGLLCLGVALPVALWARRHEILQPVGVHDQKGIVRAHWTYGRWLFASAILAVGVPDIQTILLSLLVDLKSAGALRAMMNFILPLSQLLSVLSVYSLPGLARRMKRLGTGAGLRQAILFPAAMLPVATIYLGVLLLAGAFWERLLYNGRMSEYLIYLPMLAFAALLSAVGATFSTLLRAAQNSQHQLFAGIVGTLVGTGSALLLLKARGISGAITAMILANAATSACVVGTYFWMIGKQPARWSLSLAALRE